MFFTQTVEAQQQQNKQVNIKKNYCQTQKSTPGTSV